MTLELLRLALAVVCMLGALALLLDSLSWTLLGAYGCWRASGWLLDA